MGKKDILEDVCVDPFFIPVGALEKYMDQMGLATYTIRVERDPVSKDIRGYRLARYALYEGAEVIPPQAPLAHKSLIEELDTLDPGRKRRFTKQ